MGQRVAMYVFNDVRTDARVLREAATLAAAGHRVTIVARHDDPATPFREQRSGFEIVRIAVPLWPHGAWTFLRYPWRARRFGGRLLRPGRRAFLVAIRRIAAGLAILAVAAIWSLVRLPIAFVAGRLGRAVAGRRDRQVDPADWLARWWWRVTPWAKLAARAVPDATVHHGHDLTGLAAAVRAAHGGGRLVYDTHEIFLESGSNAEQPAWIRRRWARLEQAWLSNAAAVLTVNDAIAAELRRRYLMPPIVVVHNCPPRSTAEPSDGQRLRDALGVDPDAPIALYHGAFSRHRGLEQLVDAIREPGLEGVHAVFLGYGALRAALDELAADPALGGRVHVLPPVPPDEVIDWVAGADVAVIAIQPSTLNHVLSTPNKLFEALAAGVPVVASDFPAIREIVAAAAAGESGSSADLGPTDLGILCDPSDPAAIAAAISQILSLPAAERAALRARCRAAAETRWNWERESQGLVDLFAGLR